MRILICSPKPLTKTLGGPKVYAEVAEAYRSLGAEVTLLGPQSICPGFGRYADKLSQTQAYAASLKAYLQENAASFDVIEYSHQSLPYARATFPSAPLMVARSVLLLHHVYEIGMPAWPGVRGWIGTHFRRPLRHRRLGKRLQLAQQTVEAADLVNVCNAADRDRLIAYGIDASKIQVRYFGMSDARWAAFDAISPQPPPAPRVAFVGTFDLRKGATHFPKLIAQVAQHLPDVRFRLLGARGLMKDEAEVRRFFPEALQDHLELWMRYNPDDLPALLAPCSVGVFPSYIEGFPFGVLEMQAAALPVVAFDAPGPPEMLPADLLVPPGDVEGMANKLIHLLSATEGLPRARLEARHRAQQFDWTTIAEETLAAYAQARADRPAASVAHSS